MCVRFGVRPAAKVAEPGDGQPGTSDPELHSLTGDGRDTAVCRSKPLVVRSELHEPVSGDVQIDTTRHAGGSDPGRGGAHSKPRGVRVLAGDPRRVPIDHLAGEPADLLMRIARQPLARHRIWRATCDTPPVVFAARSITTPSVQAIPRSTLRASLRPRDRLLGGCQATTSQMRG